MNKNIKQKIILLILPVLFLLLLFLLIGCNKSTQPTSEMYWVRYSATVGGRIEGLAEQIVKDGENAEAVTAIPNDGYYFVKWSDGVTTATRQDTNVTSEITVTAEFEKLSYTLHYLAGEGGSISGNANQQVKCGENAEEVTAVPNQGYYFVKWSDGVNTAIRQDTNVIFEITVTAEFEKLTYTLQYLAEEGGTISGKANQQVKYGENAEAVTAIPNDGYYFVKWSDGVTTATRNDTNVTSEITVTAEFEKLTYTLQYLAGEGGTINGKANQQVKYGENAEEVTAVPNDGYKFIGWSDGYELPIRQDLNLTSSLSVIAQFVFLYADGDGSAKNPFTITNYIQLKDIWYYPDANYKLLNDLDLIGIDHEPIFDDKKAFTGVFDGKGYSIRNLTISTENNFPSLFGFISGGIVGNLNIIDANIATVNFNTTIAREQYCVGIVAGVSAGFLHDINVSGKIVAHNFDYGYVAIGGIVGIAYGTVANCDASVHIEVSNAQSTNLNNPFVFGGLIGVCESAYIRECTANGYIEVADSWDYVLVGGLIGYYYTSDDTDTYLRNCKTEVEISGDNNYLAGGFIGKLSVSDKSSLYISEVSVCGDILNIWHSGGLIYNCHCYGELFIENCFIENKIEGYYAAGFVCSMFGERNNYVNVNVNNCYVNANIISGDTGGRTAVGFCREAHYVSFYACFTSGKLTGKYAYGFGDMVVDCKIYCCYTSVDIYALDHASGFIHYLKSCRIENSYSVCNLFCTKSGESSIINNFGGLITSSVSSEIVNCYFAGSICGVDSETHYEIGVGVGIMAGYIRDSVIENCHVLNTQENLSLPIIDSYRNQDDTQVDITVYENIEDMYLLADVLNSGLDEDVWINIEDGLPQLKL